jgi:CRISPR system Cascade subunit CasA
MTFNLITNQWIPVRLKDDSIKYIAPYEIGNTDIIALATARSDFDMSTTEFLIGLYQTVAAPKDRNAWQQNWDNIPSSEVLKDQLIRYANCFNIDGDGPRFMQDCTVVDDVEHTTNGIGDLILDTYDEKDVIPDSDLFRKHRSISTLCESCLAMTVLTLQMHASKGGSGHYTSIRGGSALTAVLVGDCLWHTIWLNVINKEDFNKYVKNDNINNTAPESIFPWMSAARNCSSTDIIHPVEYSPYRIYWARPRRIALSTEQLACKCDICGKKTQTAAKQYFALIHGEKYDSSWRYPLTYYEFDNSKQDNAELHVVQTKSDYFTYDYFSVFTLGCEYEDNRNKKQKYSMPLSIQQYREIISNCNPEQLEIFNGQVRLRLCGYAFDGCKVLGWFNQDLPMFNITAEQLNAFQVHIDGITMIARYALSELICQINKALKAISKTASTVNLSSIIKADFWNTTNDKFYDCISQLHDVTVASEILQDELRSNILNWLHYIAKTALSLYDKYTGLQANFDGCNHGTEYMKVVAHGRKQLAGLLSERVSNIDKDKKINKIIDTMLIY